MINLTDLDGRYAEFIARSTRVNREGLMTESTESPGVLQDRGEARFAERMRRRIGETLIGAGERMIGTAVAHATALEPEGYGPAA